MSNTLIEGYVPLVVPASGWREWKADFDAVVGEVLSLDTHQILSQPGDPAPFRVELVDEYPEVLEPFFKEIGSHGSLLRFTTETTYDIERYTWGSPDLQEEDKHMLARLSLGSDLLKQICDVILLSHIARPGALTTSPGEIVIDGFPSESIRGFFSDMHFALRELSPGDWPPLGSTPLASVWRWARSLPGFDEGVPKGPAGRALAAFSHFIPARNSSSPIDLLWALLALEALYCEGKDGLRNQLVRKSQRFLGERTQHKKQFGGVYDLRSRFVHGSTDFPLQYTPHDAHPDFTRFSSEQYEGTNLALAVLISTLQKMVVENRSTLEFDYILRPQEDAGAEP